MSPSVCLALFFGFILRVLLSDTPLSEWLSERNEVVTPVTSWKRVVEGLSLLNRGISPYSGDVFHETPLLLRLLNWMSNKFGSRLYISFAAIDVITAYILVQVSLDIAWHLYLQQKKLKLQFADGVLEKIGLSLEDLQQQKIWVAVFYLFNPYTVATCIAKSTGVFNNFLLAAAMLFTLKGFRNGATLFIALASYQSLYPIMLLVPAAMYIAQDEHPKEFQHLSRGALASYLKTAVVFCLWLSAFLYFSHWVERLSWDFLHSTYGFVIHVPDLTPNVGVFWYFFTEMFDHFRLFFIFVFQINVFIYTVPLAIKLRNHPIFMMYALIMLMAIFKSYPSYADSALYLSLLPCWTFANNYLRNPLVVGCMYICSSVLAPILYYLWIYAGSANANFYFAITLVYSTAQIFLLSDLLFAFLRRDYDLYHGTEHKLNGKPVEVIME